MNSHSYSAEQLAEIVSALDLIRRRPKDVYEHRMWIGKAWEALKNAAPQGNKAGAASSGAAFKASDSVSIFQPSIPESRGLPNNPAAAAQCGPSSAELVAFMRSRKRSHYYCEDPWYSCPLAEDGCADDRKPKDQCDCGVTQWNAELDAMLARLDATGSAEPALTAWIAAGAAARMQDLAISYSCTAYNQPLRETDVPLYALSDATNCSATKG